MPSMSFRELRRLGVSEEDLQSAKRLQAQQRAKGVPVLSAAVIVGLAAPRPSSNVHDFTKAALNRRGGKYDQAAFLLDQSALNEASPERAEQARNAACIAKELAASTQLEFDFFGGNVSIAHQYQDAVTERLRNSGQTLSSQHMALAVLWQITRYLAWQSYACEKSAADLCDITGIDKAQMSRSLDLLENVGAIRRVRQGRRKLITVTPEGAFRGNINKHGEAVERFRLDVIEGGRTD